MRNDCSFLPKGFASVDGMARSASFQHKRFELLGKPERWRVKALEQSGQFGHLALSMP
jgi:hypothetical protein